MYNDVFGSGSINPARRTYLSLTSAVSVALAWPVEQQISGNDVAADIMDIDMTDTSLNVDFSDARQVSNGYTGLVNNVGSNTFSVRDSAGGAIVSPAPGEAWFVYLRDNGTSAGLWRTFQLGASVSTASAAALVGAGIKAIATSLNQKMDVDSTASTPTTIVEGDRARLKNWTGGVGTFNLTAAATVGTDWFFNVRNSGSGDLAVTPPSGTIDGAASLTVAAGQSAIIVTDGTNYFSIGLGQASSSTFDFISIDIAGSGDYTLSGAELNKVSYKFTGILTANRKIIVPGAVEQYWIDNATTGAFTLEVATAAQGSPPSVVQGQRTIFYCDGTDVLDADTATVSLPVAVSDGGTGATDAATARTNLGVPPDTRDMIAGVGISGGGNLTANRTFNLDINGLTPEVAVEADEIAFYDVGGAVVRKDTIGDVVRSVVASETVTGVVERATQAEVDAGSDTIRYISPATLRTTGSFTGTLTGYAANPTGTVDFSIVGNLCTLYLTSSITGTSNSTAMTMTGLPAAVQPVDANGHILPCVVTDNGAAGYQLGAAQVVGATITFWLGSPMVSTGFTASGLKGLTNWWTIVYLLD